MLFAVAIVVALVPAALSVRNTTTLQPDAWTPWLVLDLATSPSLFLLPASVTESGEKTRLDLVLDTSHHRSTSSEVTVSVYVTTHGGFPTPEVHEWYGILRGVRMYSVRINTGYESLNRTYYVSVYGHVDTKATFSLKYRLLAKLESPMSMGQIAGILVGVILGFGCFSCGCCVLIWWVGKSRKRFSRGASFWRACFFFCARMDREEWVAIRQSQTPRRVTSSLGFTHSENDNPEEDSLIFEVPKSERRTEDEDSLFGL